MALYHDAVVLAVASFHPLGLWRLLRLSRALHGRLAAQDAWQVAFQSGLRVTHTEMGGKENMESLVSRMPPGLQKLDLRFRWCSANEGAQVLAKRLPSTLTDLALAFRGCGLGEAGARALARALPQGLRSLRLSLRGCPVGVAGAEALGQRLPQSLEALTLDFRDCRLPQRGCAALAAKLPELRALHLLLGGCDLVAGDLKVLTSLLPRSVRDLHLGFESSPLGLQGVAAVAEALGPLERLQLDLDWCNVQAEAVKILAQQLPGTLRSLRLSFSGCPLGREGAQVLAQHLARLENLERLHLDCARCRICFVGARDLLLQLPSAYAFFDFRGCNIDPEARQALRDLLPEAFSASIVF